VSGGCLAWPLEEGQQPPPHAWATVGEGRPVMERIRGREISPGRRLEFPSQAASFRNSDFGCYVLVLEGEF
jgi:hypothetical protein